MSFSVPSKAIFCGIYLLANFALLSAQESAAQMEVEQAMKQRDYLRVIELLQAQEQQQILAEGTSRIPLELDRVSHSAQVQLDPQAGAILFLNDQRAFAEWGPFRDISGYVRLVGTLQNRPNVLVRGNIEITTDVENELNTSSVIRLDRRAAGEFVSDPLFLPHLGVSLQMKVQEEASPSHHALIYQDENKLKSEELVRFSDLYLERIPNPYSMQTEELTTAREQYYQAINAMRTPLAQHQYERLTALAQQRMEQENLQGALRAENAAAQLANRYQLSVDRQQNGTIVLTNETARISSDYAGLYGDVIHNLCQDGDSITWNLRDIEIPTGDYQVVVHYSISPMADSAAELEAIIAPERISMNVALSPGEYAGTLYLGDFSITGLSNQLRLRYKTNRRLYNGIDIQRVELIPVE